MDDAPTLEQRKQQIKESFSVLPTWEDRFSYLIEMGKDLPPFSDAQKNDVTYVSGCQSDAWFVVREQGKKIEITGDAAALITKGIIATLRFLYSGSSKQELRKESFHFLEELDILMHLSPNRANGLSEMIQRIQYARN